MLAVPASSPETKTASKLAGYTKSMPTIRPMLERVPPIYKIAAFLAILLCGPITVFSFLLGGANAGIAAILAIVFFFLALYIIVMRKYG